MCSPTAYLSDEIIDLSNGGKTFDGRFRVETTKDDDFIGFVLGYKIEKTNNPKTIGASLTQNEPFVIVHWKQGDQPNDNLGFGKAGFEARMVEMVSGSTFNNNAFWQHIAENTSTTSNGYKWTSLQRGSTLGNVGWTDQQEYKITFTLEETRLQVWVDGVKQIDVGPPAGMATFPVGRFGFYNHSQEKVLYKGFTQGPPVNAGGSPGDDDNVPCVAQVCDTKTYSGPGTYTSASTNVSSRVLVLYIRTRPLKASLL